MRAAYPLARGRGAVLLPLLLLAACGPRTEALRISGTVEAREVRVGSKLAGRVVEVPIEEGATVTAGAVLVRFDRAELAAERAQLDARLAQAEAELLKLTRGYRAEEVQQAEANLRREEAGLAALEKGPREQEIAQARATYEAARAAAVNAKSNYDRIAALHKSGDIAAQAHDDARSRNEAAAKNAEAARQQVALLEAGTRPEDIRAASERVRAAQAATRQVRSGYRPEEIAQAKARVAEARALLEQNAVRMKETELTAPSKSTVETVGVRPGDLVAAGRIVVTLLEQTQLWVRAYVPEPELGRVAVGQKVTVKIDTFPGKSFNGSIEQIANQAEFLPRNVQTREDRGRQVFAIRVRVHDDAGALKPGMAADVTF